MTTNRRDVIRFGERSVEMSGARWIGGKANGIVLMIQACMVHTTGSAGSENDNSSSQYK